MNDEIITVEITKTAKVHPVVRLFQARFGVWIVGAISFLESATVLPIITDPFMVVYILANQNRAVLAVVVTTATSVLGGVAAYFMAFFFSDFVLSFLSPATFEYFETLAKEVRLETFMFTILGAITPIPYTLVGLAIGFVKANLLVFIIASILGRGLRYVVVGYLTYTFGIHATKYIRRYLKWITIATFVLAGLYALYKIFI